MNLASRVTSVGSLVLLGVALGACQPQGRCCDPCARTPVPPPAPPTSHPMPVPTVAQAPVPAPVVADAAKPAAPVAGEASAADEAAAKAVHNYKRLSPRLARGAVPEDDAAFAALAAAGIKSIVTVDGAAPDVEGAKRHGIRYVHVPIGYDGIPAPTALELAKTFELLAPLGPVFVHCHHGKHRGPAACGIASVMLDGVSNDAVIADMKAAGTDPKYAGLYESLRAFRKPTAEELASVKADLPEKAPAGSRAAAMAAIDHTWDRMKGVRKAQWAVSADHADVEPAHEATILAEGLREFGRRPEIAAESEAFRKLLADSEAYAWDLAKALEKGQLDAARAEAAFTATQKACAECHTQFRDNTHR